MKFCLKIQLPQVLRRLKVENTKKRSFYEVKLKTAKFKCWYFQNQ